MNITRRRAEPVTRASLLAMLLACATPLGALELALPPGARETVSRSADPGTYRLPIAPWSEETGLPVAELEGRVTRRAWRLAGLGATTLQVMAPLRDQLVGAGYQVILDCASRACGGFDFRFETEVLRAPNMYVDLNDFRFLSLQAPEGTSALSLLVSRNGETVYVQLIQVGATAQEGVSVTADASPDGPVPASRIVAELEENGHSVLDDLDFESGSSSLGGGSVASLDKIAAYLLANPGRQITFVGHTDATGSLDANIALSRRRAEAAKAYVLERHGVPAGQVASEGVGFLAPRASNLSDAGREANRRVEAVLISTR